MTTSPSSTTTTTLTVTGMTCDHCVQAVTKEVTTIGNVQDVAVDLASGGVTVTTDGVLDQAAFAAAIDEAGFELG